MNPISELNDSTTADNSRGVSFGKAQRFRKMVHDQSSSKVGPGSYQASSFINTTAASLLDKPKKKGKNRGKNMSFSQRLEEKTSVRTRPGGTFGVAARSVVTSPTSRQQH